MLFGDWIRPGQALAQWTHFVTSTCNARCKHCFYPINQKKNELTLDEIEKLTRSLPPIRLLLFSGGEPFLRTDLVEIVGAYWQNCSFFSASIPTNGFNATRIAEKTEQICSISPDLELGIAVSIDGFAGYHDSTRGVPGLFDKAVETVAALRELSRRCPTLTVAVNTVFMRDNQNEVELFCRYVRDELRPTYHALVLIRGEPNEPELKEDLDLELYSRLAHELDGLYPILPDAAAPRGLRGRLRSEVNRRRIDYIVRQARGGGFEKSCLAGEREYVLSETGDVYGCELIDTRLGNVREVEFDFQRIRMSNEAFDFIDEKKKQLCRCTHECNTRSMILFDRSNALPVLASALKKQPR
jgi:radical SAM protein with 4Fe4S-binding SPASM domain